MNNFDKMQTELKQVITKYTDDLTLAQIIAILELQKLTLAHLCIADMIEETYK